MWAHNCSSLAATRCEAAVVQEITYIHGAYGSSIHPGFHSPFPTKSVFHLGQTWMFGSVGFLQVDMDRL